MDKKNFYKLLKSVPKAEIHIHQEAVISKKTIKKVYKNGTGKILSEQEYESLFAYTDLAGFLDSFLKIQSYVNNIDDLNYFFDDFKQYLIKNNIIYCETFFSVTSYLKKGWAFHDLLDLVSKNIKKIKTETGRTVKILIDVSRSFGIENAMNNLNSVLKENNPEVLGIGLGGNEKTGPAKDFASVFDKAVNNGLHVVVHAGEICDYTSIDDAIKFLHAERIGHGITAIQSEDFMAELKKSQIPLEVCPTSNTFTKTIVKNIKEHPIKTFYDKGLMVTVNTDDPTFFKVSLIDEYWNLYKNLNFSLEDIKQLIKNGFKASFASDSAKKKYCSLVEKEWQTWFAENPQCAKK